MSHMPWWYWAWFLLMLISFGVLIVLAETR